MTDSQRMREQVQSLTSAIEKLHIKIDAACGKIDTIHAKQDETSLDMMQLKGFLKSSMNSVGLKLDAVGVNSDSVSAAKAGGTDTKRKPAITGWFKVWAGAQLLPLDTEHLLEQLDSTRLGKTHKIDLDLHDLLEFVLDKQSKLTKVTKRKTRKDELEFLGSQMWKEMSSMIKNPEPTDTMDLMALKLLERDWAKVQANIKRIREEEELELVKQKTIALKREASVEIPPPDMSSSSVINVDEF